MFLCGGIRPFPCLLPSPSADAGERAYATAEKRSPQWYLCTLWWHTSFHVVLYKNLIIILLLLLLLPPAPAEGERKRQEDGVRICIFLPPPSPSAGAGTGTGTGTGTGAGGW